MGGRGAFLKIWLRQFEETRYRSLWYRMGMTKIIDENEHFKILDVTFMCCDASQFRHICKVCDEYMDCYFCSFDPYEAHCSDTLQP